MILLGVNNNPIGVIISVFVSIMFQPHSLQLAIMSSFHATSFESDRLRYAKWIIGGIALLIANIFAAVSKV